MAKPISGVKPQSWNKHFSKWMKRKFWKRHRMSFKQRRGKNENYNLDNAGGFDR
jgi:hypothetical protein